MPRTFRFDKLVTDLVVKNSIEEPHTLDIKYRELNGTALLRELRRKLVEEAREIPVVEGATKEVLDEIADAQNVLDEIKRRYGIDESVIRDHQLHRREKKGDFSKGYYVDDVVLRDDSPWIGYFEADSARYPEVVEGRERVVPGEYEHFEGDRYEVLGEGLHSETDEPLVIYCPLYNSQIAIWACPRSVFTEMVETDEGLKSRFRRVDD